MNIASVPLQSTPLQRASEPFRAVNRALGFLCSLDYLTGVGKPSILDQWDVFNPIFPGSFQFFVLALSR